MAYPFFWYQKCKKSQSSLFTISIVMILWINLKQCWQTFCNFSNLCQLLSNFHKSMGKKLGKSWSWTSSMIFCTFCNFQEILIYRQLFYRLVTIISLLWAEKIKVKFSNSLFTIIIIKHDKINQENKNILIKKPSMSIFWPY